MNSMKNFMNINYLIQSENKTLSDSHIQVRDIFVNYPVLIDLLLKLPYFSGNLKKPNTNMGKFQLYCLESYIQAPYTFRAIYILCEKGYYLESIILFRHLLEIFIQMRYFNKYPNKLEGHMIIKKDRISFKTIFDEFSIGYYDKYYATQFSEFAHGKKGKSLFRFEQIDSNKRIAIMGNYFNKVLASYIMSNVITLLYGYINFFEVFFPNNISRNHRPIMDELIEIKTRLQNFKDEHKKINPKSLEWHKHWDQLYF